jgi:phosphoglycolate phosphatase-like HAD superfamily hydrolase
MEVTVFDLDGTLFDITHRLKYINGDVKDYDAFFGKAVLQDKPIWPIISLVHMHQDLKMPYILASGRSEVSRKDTITVLARYNIEKYERLYMRPEGSRKPDWLVKSWMLEKMLKEGYQPTLVFDDRQQVVDMWRSKGIRVAQVEKGDF